MLMSNLYFKKLIEISKSKYLYITWQIRQSWIFFFFQCLGKPFRTRKAFLNFRPAKLPFSLDHKSCLRWIWLFKNFFKFLCSYTHLDKACHYLELPVLSRSISIWNRPKRKLCEVLKGIYFFSTTFPSNEAWILN